ncbi:MAG: hypothetical protein Q9195_005678 [Heterodermia aff. obscurata]
MAATPAKNTPQPEQQNLALQDYASGSTRAMASESDPVSHDQDAPSAEDTRELRKKMIALQEHIRALTRKLHSKGNGPFNQQEDTQKPSLLKASTQPVPDCSTTHKIRTSRTLSYEESIAKALVDASHELAQAARAWEESLDPRILTTVSYLNEPTNSQF